MYNLYTCYHSFWEPHTEYETEGEAIDAAKQLKAENRLLDGAMVENEDGETVFQC